MTGSSGPSTTVEEGHCPETCDLHEGSIVHIRPMGIKDEKVTKDLQARFSPFCIALHRNDQELYVKHPTVKMLEQHNGPTFTASDPFLARDVEKKLFTDQGKEAISVYVKPRGCRLFTQFDLEKGGVLNKSNEHPGSVVYKATWKQNQQTECKLHAYCYGVKTGHDEKMPAIGFLFRSSLESDNWMFLHINVVRAMVMEYKNCTLEGNAHLAYAEGTLDTGVSMVEGKGHHLSLYTNRDVERSSRPSDFYINVCNTATHSMLHAYDKQCPTQFAPLKFTCCHTQAYTGAGDILALSLPKDCNDYLQVGKDIVTKLTTRLSGYEAVCCSPDLSGDRVRYLFAPFHKTIVVACGQEVKYAAVPKLDFMATASRVDVLVVTTLTISSANGMQAAESEKKSKGASVQSATPRVNETPTSPEMSSNRDTQSARILSDQHRMAHVASAPVKDDVFTISNRLPPSANQEWDKFSDEGDTRKGREPETASSADMNGLAPGL